MLYIGLKSVGLPVGFRRLAARALDKLITRVQEWLEGPDRPAARGAALAVIITSIAYMTVHLVLKLCSAN